LFFTRLQNLLLSSSDCNLHVMNDSTDCCYMSGSRDACCP